MKRIMTSGRCFALASVISVGVSLLNAAQFQNGSFESPVLAPGSSLVLAPGTNGLTGWTVGNTGAVSFVNGPAVYGTAGGVGPFDGAQQIGFNGGDTPPGGWISQTFSTLVGQSYSVSFNLGRVFPGSGTMSLRADV